jgi:hypothetical protein
MRNSVDAPDGAPLLDILIAQKKLEDCREDRKGCDRTEAYLEGYQPTIGHTG